MQKFTRALTREVEVEGQRIAVTLDADGLSLRPVGSRRPARGLSWASVLSLVNDHVSPVGNEDSLGSFLRRVDDWLARHRKRYHKALLPGATEADLALLQKVLGKPIPEELWTWLAWHNGQDPEIIGAFESGYNLMSAARIARTKEELDRENHPGWQDRFVPFLDDDRDNYLLLDLAADPPGVRACWRTVAEHNLVAPSLTAWVRAFVEGLEAGTYHEDPERGSFYRE